MLNIQVSEAKIGQIQEWIQSEDRLGELIVINGTKEPQIKIEEKINVEPVWNTSLPPVLIPAADYSKNNFLGLVFASLHNYEKAYPLLQESPHLLGCIDAINRLQNGVAFDSLLPGADYFSLHNNAVIQHYGFVLESDYDNLQDFYEKAIECSPADTLKSFTSFHYGQWLADFGYITNSEQILNTALQYAPKGLPQIAIKSALCYVWQKILKQPYDKELMQKLKDTLWSCLEYYEQYEMKVETAMTLNDAANIATLSESYTEALGYVNRAIAVFDEENLPELKGQAQLTKANLFLVWAKNGNPQFFKSAIQEYQNALRIFTRESAPDVFANIHHQLGIVYAEIPDEVKKKGVWASVSVSSFNEALSFYNKIDYPAEFASICHSMGIAYTKFPQGLNSDNFDKALAWYREALDVRTATQYPIDRVHTLCNYLEASWFAGNKNEFDEQRYGDMKSIANEILALTNDEQIIAQVKDDLLKLETLKNEAVSNA